MQFGLYPTSSRGCSKREIRGSIIWGGKYLLNGPIFRVGYVARSRLQRNLLSSMDILVSFLQHLVFGGMTGPSQKKQTPNLRTYDWKIRVYDVQPFCRKINSQQSLGHNIIQWLYQIHWVWKSHGVILSTDCSKTKEGWFQVTCKLQQVHT